MQFYYDSDNNKVRTYQAIDGTVWFCAKDVCEILEIQNVTQALETLDEDERAMYYIGRSPIHGGGGEANFVNESGLYALVFKSRKPEARKFRKWVTSVVLPEYRQQGPRKITLSFSATVAEANMLKRLAQSQGTNLSRLLLRICENYLDEQEALNNG